jgi:hypothetical protein
VSRDLPSPKTVDGWCEQLKADLDWLYDHRAGRAGHYAWAHNAVDGLRSPSGIVGVPGEPADPTGRHAVSRRFSRTKQAAQQIEQATKALRAARAGLEEKDLTPTEGPNIVFLRKGELDNLYRKQREREMRGGGFGDT